jgi:hypothetical protein
MDADLSDVVEYREVFGFPEEELLNRKQRRKRRSRKNRNL